MKNYTFEREYNADGSEEVKLHGKAHGFRLGTKLFCVLLAFLFWLIVTNVHLTLDRQESEQDTAPQTQETA